MNKAVFLDRDGTINVEKHYLYRILDFEFLPGTVDALKQLRCAGYLLIIITNQSGIGRGYYSEEDFRKLNDWMVSELKLRGVIVSDVYYCPHLPNAEIEAYRKDCECRKPKLGMYLKAVKEHNIDLSQSYAIGDKLRDCAICETTACKGYLIGENEKISTIEKVKKGEFARVCYAADLAACTREIVGYNTKKERI